MNSIFLAQWFVKPFELAICNVRNNKSRAIVLLVPYIKYDMLFNFIDTRREERHFVHT